MLRSFLLFAIAVSLFASGTIAHGQADNEQAAQGYDPATPRFPGAEWTLCSPREAGLNRAQLDEIAEYLGGRGCIVRHAKLTYHWGDYKKRGDVASAAKPWYATFLFKAVEDGLLPDLDAPVVSYEPRLGEINKALGYKDKAMTFAHMANQTSCYGVREAPGTAYDYNDWQMALFFDTLFVRIYGAAWETVDEKVLHPLLTDLIDCEDNPTFMAFGTGDRPGRLAVSPRDFARFGWLYLNEGNWNGRQVISREHVRMAVSNPLPNSIPRTAAKAAEMIPEQRTMGSRSIPDDQTDHLGSYSWLWWVNGVDRQGRRLWPDAPGDVYAALGHANGQRGMAAIPSLDLVISWNDTTLGNRPAVPHPLNEVFRLLTVAAADEPMQGQVIADPANPAWLVRNRDKDRDGRLDPFFMCGPGDPEDFLYRGKRLADGTRDGDQDAIIGKVARSGANSLYFQTVRSHGGDGDRTHNPFVDSDPTEGLDEDILAQWERWFRAMDHTGIVPLFFIYDDSARIWDTGDAVGPDEQSFIQTLVNRFEHHKNLIWCVAEEYQERYSPQRVRAIARVIRATDEHQHPIAVHKWSGLGFEEFAEDANIDQFAVQYNVPEAGQLHDGVVEAWGNARGRYNLNLSEAADFGNGATAREKAWSIAMGGAYVMALGWTFDRDDNPSSDDLAMCRYLVSFFEKTDFNALAPHDELRFAGTQYVLAKPGDSYIAYAPERPSRIGLRSMDAGPYVFRWFDPATGESITQEGVQVAAGDQSWAVPDKIRYETVVWIKRTAASSAG